MPVFFVFDETSTTEIYTLSLHDALPILSANVARFVGLRAAETPDALAAAAARGADFEIWTWKELDQRSSRAADRKSTRLNSSHSQISYAVFCLKKKKKNKRINHAQARAR